jgi:hypothetical protein
MSPVRRVRRPRRQGLLILVGLIAGWLVAAPEAAHAGFGDFVAVYQQIESYAPSGSLPVKSTDLVAYQSLFSCVEGGGDVVVCTDQYHKTEAGKKAAADIPEGVWRAVDAYVAWKAGDTWGVVAALGEAALCAILQVLAGGFDACGLIKDLIALGEAFLDAAKAAGEFFKDLGEGAWNVAKGAYCGTLGQVLGGCDDSGPPPKPVAQVIYEKFFAPKVLPDGLDAIEADDGLTFPTLTSQLGDQAKAAGYAPSDVVLAAAIFGKAVDKQWTADVVQNGLKDLAAKRKAYNTAGFVVLSAHAAWDRYAKSKEVPLPGIVDRCVDYFEKSGFAHVDRWIYTHNEAKQLGAQRSYPWCETVFWAGNKAKFVQYFKQKMDTVCPGLGCTSKTDLEFCQPLMKSFGLNCGLTAKLEQQPPPTVKAPSTPILPKPPGPSAQRGPVMPVEPKGLPDITSAAQLVVGATTTPWRATVNVDAGQAGSAQGGVCQVAVQHTARNVGLAASGAFGSVWTNSGAPGSVSRRWGSIAPGAQDTQKDLIALKPGQNILELTLDDLNQVQEVNENNNRFRVVVNLSGSCGGAPAGRLAPAPVTPSAPSERLPRR